MKLKEIKEKGIKNLINLDKSINHKIILISIVIIVLVLSYLITLYITKDNSNSNIDNNNDKEVSIQYDEILIGSSFDKEGEYYVLYYDFSSEENNELSSLLSSYKQKEDKKNIYSVDMSNSFNKNNIGENINYNPSNASELVINGPTLILFNNGEVNEYIDNLDEIKELLK